MSSKRTADGLKKAAAAGGGQRQFKQTTLNFGRPASASSSLPTPRPRQEATTAIPEPAQSASSRTTDSHTAETREETSSERVHKRRSLATFNFGREASKENRPPPPPPPPPPGQQSRAQPEDGNQPQRASSNSSGGTSSAENLIRITDIQGDLFSAPQNTVLIHACNSIGSWGGGIALAFKKSYPEAYKIYAAHCKRYAADPRKLVGTALLIPPPPSTPPPSSAEAAAAPPLSSSNTKGSRMSSAAEARKQHYIGCLFTSKAYGRGRDSPRDILRATAPALGDLIKMISAERRKNREAGNGTGPGEIRMCQINSGLFDVPWRETKRVVAEMRVEDILEREGEGEEEEEGDEVLRELGNLPVDIAAYWRADL